jgi:hypothetical protein
MAPAATLLGDVVASRDYANQQELFTLLADHFDWVNQQVTAIQPLQLTVGDEFQALYERLADAVRASVLLRLRLAGRLDLRFGVGWGEVITHSAISAPSAQSGKAWWNAREALDLVASVESSKKKWPVSLRSWLVAEDGPEIGWARAALVFQDQVLATMDEKDAAITLALLAGERQVDLASELDLSQGSISRRQREKGPSAVFRAYRELEGRSSG